MREAAATPAAKPTKSTKTAKAARIPTQTRMVSISSTAVNTRAKTLEQVLDNMAVQSGTGIILTGATGIGKTTFIKQLGKLLGMNVELIEAPHITEEHLINIPFVTFLPTGATRTGQVDLDPTKINIALAQSHLASLLKSSKPVPDSQYKGLVQRFDNNTRALYQKLGGNEETIPDEIAELRGRYRTILFLDEYWRQTSMNVRNILRGILNGRIGNDRIPPGVYTIYASNVRDVGQTIEDIPTNADFKMVDFKPPTKDEFFHFLISNAQENNITLNPELVNAFHKALDDSHISYDDAETAIRTSPRRWQQLLLYINANLPVDSKAKAQALLANVEANFRSEDDKSGLHKLVDTVVRDVIEATGGKEFRDEKALDAGQWRSTLEQQIETKIKMGDSRSYVPVVMGAPGIGKTTQMHDVADRLNLRLIVIDASTLTTDDVTGIPVPRREVSEARDDLSVGFAEPALYKRIMQDAQEADQQFLQDPHVPEEKKAAYKKQKFKYLLFFDELNRVGNQNVFNSLRRVILDKSFNDQTHLPGSMIVVAAMNPDDKGTAELTGHLKDAVDLIDAMPSWQAFEAYMDSYENSARMSKYPQEARVMSRKLLDGFVETFAIKTGTKKIPRDARKFNIKLSADEIMYVSPREYASLYAELVAAVSRELKRLDPDNTQHEKQFYDAAVQKFESTLKWIMEKHKIESPQFLMAVASWLTQQMPQFMIKQRTGASLEAMLDEVLSDPSQHLRDNANFVNYARNFERNKFTEDLLNYINRMVEQEKNKYDIWAKDQVSKKKLEDGKLVVVKELWSKLEAVNEEIYLAAKAFDLSADILDTLDQTVIDALVKISEEVDLPEDQAKEIVMKGVEKMHGMSVSG